VHRLRVILLRETDDVRLADLSGTEVDDLADAEILEIARQWRNIPTLSVRTR
jgi:hypothetical protein